MSFISSATRSRSVSYGNKPLSDDELRAFAPSIFAEAAHESRSERYAYVPTSDVLARMRREGFEPVHAVQGRSRVPGKADYTKHLIRFRRAGETEARREIGGLFPEVAVINSHDGTSSFQVIAGLFRMVCLNGLLVHSRELSSVRVPHKGDIEGEVLNGSFTVLEESRRALDRADAWAGVSLSQGDQLALADAVRTVRFGDAQGVVTSPVRPADMLVARRREDVRDDLWTVTNRLQENAIRGGLRTIGRDSQGRRRRVTTKEIRSVDENVRLNRAIWQLSEHFARERNA